MKKINQEEYEVLKELDDKWKWIARDDSKSLFMFVEKPYKKNGMKYWDVSNYTAELVGSIKSDLFQFIQWEDLKPYNITELIEEYEEYEEHEFYNYVGWKYYKKGKAEVKNIEWAKKEIKELMTEESQNYPHDEMVEKEIVLGILNQLDEPEVLSQEWIKKNKREWTNLQGTKDYIAVDKLKNKLLPKQELPVIPKFVAEWIEGNKQFEEKWNDYSKEDAMNDTIHFTIYGLFADYPSTNSHVELRKPVLKWLSDDRGNYFNLVNAIRYGYEVEEEQKYYVEINGHYLSRGATKLFLHERKPTILKHIFTEQEIKDYDDRYWPFAVKIEELKE